MVRFYPECGRARHPFSNLRSGAASARHSSRIPPPPPEPDSRSLTSFGNLQTFQHSNLPTFLRSIPFIITFFAHPHHLTLTESYSYRKRGRGWVSGAPKHFLFFPQLTNVQHTATPATLIFSCAYFTVLWIPWGWDLRLSLSASAHSASLRYPFQSLAFPTWLNTGEP